MIVTSSEDLTSFLASRSGRAVAIRSVGMATFETLPAGAWCWTDARELRAPGRFHLYLCEIMEAADPSDVAEPERHESVRLFAPAPNQIPGQLAM